MFCCKPPLRELFAHVIQKEDYLNIVIQLVEMFVSSTKEHWCFTNLDSHGIRSQCTHLSGSIVVSHSNCVWCIFSLFYYYLIIQTCDNMGICATSPVHNKCKFIWKEFKSLSEINDFKLKIFFFCSNYQNDTNENSLSMHYCIKNTIYDNYNTTRNYKNGQNLAIETIVNAI